MRGIVWGREVSGQSDQRVIWNTKIIRRAIGSRAIVNGGMCVGRELISITARDAFLAFGRIDELFAGMKATDMPIDKVCAGKPTCAIGTTKWLFLSI
jgi:hypothetical protein